MADLTVTATPEPGNLPPRVRVDVLDEGNAPAISQVTVVRVDPDGTSVAVRSNDGNPLTLEPNGTSRTGTIFDPEAHYGIPYHYSTVQQPESTSAEVSLDADRPWLVHPGVPALSQPVEFRVGSFSSRKRAVRSGVFYPLGRDTAVVITDGRRKRPESTFVAHTKTPEAADALLSLIDDAGVMLLNVPPSMGLGIASAYIAVLDVEERRPSDIGEDPQRDWVMPYVEVAMPTGGVSTSWTWADVMARYATWQDVIDDNRTWADLLDPTD